MDGEATVPVCDVCAHPMSSHDAIGARYCRASRGRVPERDCLCPERVATDKTVDESAVSTTLRAAAPMYGRGRFSRT